MVGPDLVFEHKAIEFMINQRIPVSDMGRYDDGFII